LAWLQQKGIEMSASYSQCTDFSDRVPQLSVWLGTLAFALSMLAAMPVKASFAESSPQPRAASTEQIDWEQFMLMYLETMLHKLNAPPPPTHNSQAYMSAIIDYYAQNSIPDMRDDEKTDFLDLLNSTENLLLQAPSTFPTQLLADFRNTLEQMRSDLETMRYPLARGVK
jgi:hypothetical protein